MIPPIGSKATTDIKEALQGANYCVMGIEHGNRHRTWEQDYYVPRRFGCKAVYGENGETRWGIPYLASNRSDDGYYAHNGKFMPRCLDVRLCQPSPPVHWAMTRGSKIKVVGLCHGIRSGYEALSDFLNCQNRDLDFISAGLNHFYWFTKCTNKKELNLPEIGDLPAETVPVNTDLIPIIKQRGMVWAHEHEFSLIEELLQTYGYFTYPDQSHPAEYIHWADAYCPQVKCGFRGAGNTEFKQHMQDSIDSKTDNYWWVAWSNERAVHIIKGMEKDTGQRELAVNMPNHGSIARLPDDCVVETPATVDRNGVHPEIVGKLPRGITAMLQQEAALQDMVVEAGLQGDYELAVQALSMDPMVPSPQVARALLDAMIEIQERIITF